MSSSKVTIRVRSSLGTWRFGFITDERNITLEQLKSAIRDQYGIAVECQILSKDNECYNVLKPDQASLSDLGVKHGEMVYLSGRFEKQVVEKSYIGENGVVVSAGVKVNIANQRDEQSKSAKVEEIDSQKPVQCKQVDLQKSTYSSAVSQYAPAEAKLEEIPLHQDEFPYQDGPMVPSPEVRPADPVRRTNLLYDEDENEDEETWLHSPSGYPGPIPPDMDVEAITALLAAGVSVSDIFSTLPSRDPDIENARQRQTAALASMSTLAAGGDHGRRRQASGIGSKAIISRAEPSRHSDSMDNDIDWLLRQQRVEDTSTSRHLHHAKDKRVAAPADEEEARMLEQAIAASIESAKAVPVVEPAGRQRDREIGGMSGYTAEEDDEERILKKALAASVESASAAPSSVAAMAQETSDLALSEEEFEEQIEAMRAIERQNELKRVRSSVVESYLGDPSLQESKVDSKKAVRALISPNLTSRGGRTDPYAQRDASSHMAAANGLKVVGLSSRPAARDTAPPSLPTRGVSEPLTLPYSGAKGTRSAASRGSGYTDLRSTRPSGEPPKRTGERVVGSSKFGLGDVDSQGGVTVKKVNVYGAQRTEAAGASHVSSSRRSDSVTATTSRSTSKASDRVDGHLRDSVVNLTGLPSQTKPAVGSRPSSAARYRSTSTTTSVYPKASGSRGYSFHSPERGSTPDDPLPAEAGLRFEEKDELERLTRMFSANPGVLDGTGSSSSCQAARPSYAYGGTASTSAMSPGRGYSSYDPTPSYRVPSADDILARLRQDEEDFKAAVAASLQMSAPVAETPALSTTNSRKNASNTGTDRALLRPSGFEEPAYLMSQNVPLGRGGGGRVTEPDRDISTSIQRSVALSGSGGSFPSSASTSASSATIAELGYRYKNSSTASSSIYGGAADNVKLETDLSMGRGAKASSRGSGYLRDGADMLSPRASRSNYSHSEAKSNGQKTLEEVEEEELRRAIAESLKDLR